MTQNTCQRVHLTHLSLIGRHKMDTSEMSLRSAATLILFTLLFGVYLHTFGDLPEPMVAPNYSIGQLKP